MVVINSNSRILRTMHLILIIVLFCPFSHAKIIYVDDNAAGSNDGTSWENAYIHLQDALGNASSSEKPTEIRVAQGIYKPDQGEKYILGSREATFRLINDVSIRGGFTGNGTPDPNARDIGKYETILSGDLDGNDADVIDPCDLLTEVTRADNSYHIVRTDGIGTTALLEGLTISGGNANDDITHNNGAGIHQVSSNLKVLNCTFRNNSAESFGGSIYNNLGKLQLEMCIFNRNSAGNGGGLSDHYGNAKLLKCTFDNNFAGSGAGMHCSVSSPNLTSCIFSNNRASNSGGGVYMYDDNEYTDPKFTDCIFNNNSSNWGGGISARWWTYSKERCIQLTRCLFRSNSAVYYGGGIFNEYYHFRLTSCNFVENSAKQGGGIANYSSNYTTDLNNCTFTKNRAVEGAGIESSAGRHTLNKCNFFGNFAEQYGGGMRMGGCDSFLTKCRFTGNSAGMQGGAAYFDRWADSDITNCIFSGNLAETGGSLGFRDSKVNVLNCSIAGGSAVEGAAVTYRTLYHNEICYLRIRNCILWNFGGEIWTTDQTKVTVTYSNVQDSWHDNRNIKADPLFEDPGYWDPNNTPDDPNDDVWIDGDYHLKSQAGRWDPNSQSWIYDDVTSPCIDAGDPNSPIGDEPYPHGDMINMGAYGGTSEGSKSLRGTYTYVFVPEQSTIIHTGGIAGVNWTYTLSGQFRLTVDFGVGQAWFSNVEATATDESMPDRKLDPNDVFNLTGLTGTIGPNGSIQFTGQAADGSDVLIDLTLSDESVSLKGQTIPPPDSADFFIFNLDAVAQRKYGGGTGSLNNPYFIYTSKQLNTIGAEPNDWDKHFKLMADIDLSGFYYDAALIAPDVNSNDPAFQGTSFTGVFDGGGHTISNFTITGESYLGLFGRAEYQAQIKNLGVVDVNITGADYLGGIVGFSKGNITNSYCTGTINGDQRLGGLSGRNWGNITASYNSAAVTGNDDIGGIAGGNYGSIANCYNCGAVAGNWDVGGLVGENYSTIATCYSTCTVSGETRTGGLVGYNYQDSIITSSFWDVETSGQSISDGGGTGLTTAEMQMAGTFLDAGWDFVDETANGTEDIWWILEGQDYPRLWWEAEQIYD